MKAKTNGVPFPATADKKLSPAAQRPGGGEGEAYTSNIHRVHCILDQQLRLPYLMVTTDVLLC